MAWTKTQKREARKKRRMLALVQGDKEAIAQLAKEAERKRQSRLIGAHQRTLLLLLLGLERLKAIRRPTEQFSWEQELLYVLATGDFISPSRRQESIISDAHAFSQYHGQSQGFRLDVRTTAFSSAMSKDFCAHSLNFGRVRPLTLHDLPDDVRIADCELDPERSLRVLYLLSSKFSYTEHTIKFGFGIDNILLPVRLQCHPTR